MDQTSSTTDANNSSTNSLAGARLCELSMEQQARWVQEIFKRMALHYGSLFIDRWRDVNPDEMQTHWANELGPYNAPTIGRALKALDGNPLPPSLPEFKALCKAFYEPPATPRLESVPASQEEANASLVKVREIVGLVTAEKSDYRKWAREIIELWDEGEYSWIAGYEIACRAMNITPNPRPVMASARDRQYAH